MLAFRVAAADLSLLNIRPNVCLGRFAENFMVQPANMRSFDYAASLRRLDRPTRWRVFRQGQVRSEDVVVIDVVAHLKGAKTLTGPWY